MKLISNADISAEDASTMTLTIYADNDAVTVDVEGEDKGYQRERLITGCPQTIPGKRTLTSAWDINWVNVDETLSNYTGKVSIWDSWGVNYKQTFYTTYDGQVEDISEYYKKPALTWLEATLTEDFVRS